jgi:hypothetical protein
MQNANGTRLERYRTQVRPLSRQAKGMRLESVRQLITKVMLYSRLVITIK